MFAVVNIRYGGQREYFRTREEAEQHIAGRVLHTAAEGDILGPDYLNIEVVERPSRPCKFCGTEVQVDLEKHPDTDWCRNCHYLGVHDDDERMNQRADFVTALGADRVTVEHTGGGCFWMAFMFEDDPGHYYIATDGEASLPEGKDGKPIRGGWGAIQYITVDSSGGEGDERGLWDFYESETLKGNTDRYWDEYPKHSLTDQQLIDLIKADRERRAA